MGLEDKSVITVALSGVAANRDQCPYIPYTPEEYAAESKRSFDNGCTMVHIHAREPDGTPTHRVGAYKDIRDAILSEVPDMIINFSTGSVGIPVEERIAHIRELKPDIGALNMGSMNYAKYSPKRKAFVFDLVFSNPFSDIMKFLTTMNEVGVKPELESFDTGHIGNSYPLIDMGVLQKPIHYSLILGVVGGALPTTESLAFMKSLLPEGSDWGVIGVSHDQWKLAAAASTLGGNVRVGYEDNFYLPDGEMAKSNGELAAAAASIIRSTGRGVATAAEARQKIGLAGKGLSVATNVEAEMVANVWKVLVQEGATVTAGETLVILESMKMEIPVEAPVDGTVSAVKVEEGGVVQEGDVIAVIE